MVVAARKLIPLSQALCNWSMFLIMKGVDLEQAGSTATPITSSSVTSSFMDRVSSFDCLEIA